MKGLQMADFKDPKDIEIFKEALREAIDEWMDKQFSKFGKWSLYGVLTFAFGVLTYLFLCAHGLKL